MRRCFPSNEPDTEQSKAKQCHATILAAGCCASAVRVDVGKGKVTRVGDCSNRMLLSPTGKSAEEITWPCMQAATTRLQQRWILIIVHMGTCAAGGGLGWSAEQERPATAR